MPYVIKDAVLGHPWGQYDTLIEVQNRICEIALIRSTACIEDYELLADSRIDGVEYDENGEDTRQIIGGRVIMKGRELIAFVEPGYENVERTRRSRWHVRRYKSDECKNGCSVCEREHQEQQKAAQAPCNPE